MLTYEKARRIGIDACIDKLGRDFVMKYKDSATSGCGDRGDHVYCYVGVNDKPELVPDEGLVLTSNDPFPYIARCTVGFLDGEVTYLNCILPS